MAERLEGLSVTNPNGLKAGESLPCSSFSVALAITVLPLLLLPPLLQQTPVVIAPTAVEFDKEEEESGRLRRGEGKEEAIG